MAEYIIDKIEYGGNVYKLQDNVSDFLTGAVTSLSTTEGHHSTITNQNGAVSVAIPTNTSHLTNDSGFVRQFKVTVTKNGSTYTADKTFAEIQAAYNQGYELVCESSNGTLLPLLAIDENNGVFFETVAMSVDDRIMAEKVIISTSNEITSGTETADDSDENLLTTNIASNPNSTTYPIVGTNLSSASIKYIDTTGFIYDSSNGSSLQDGYAFLTLGNDIASGVNDNKEGLIKLFSKTQYPVWLQVYPLTAERSITFPDKDGTVALISDMPTITLNGSTTSTPSFYAPTTAGTDGYFLKSNGSGAPTWEEVETTAVQIIRWGD